MEEKEIKNRTKKYLERSGYKITNEPKVTEEIRLDLYAFKYTNEKHKTYMDEEGEKPDVIWIECKGDIGFSMVLEGLVRTAFANYVNGGHGMLSLPRKQYLVMKRYKNFMKCRGKIEVICVEGKIESFKI